MKRNMDLIRKLLFEIEEKSTGLGSVEISLDDYSPNEVGYHLKLIVESGFATGSNTSTMRSEYPEYLVTDLTPDGHDFIDAIRSENIWNSTKEKISEVGSWTLEIVKAVAVNCINEQLK